MAAATSMVRIPLFQEGTEFWKALTDECKRRIVAINNVAREAGQAADRLVEWISGTDIHMARNRYPSTDIKIDLEFHSWGPTINGRITGREDDDVRFVPEEFEFTIAQDLDGSTILIYDEGRSFTAEEFAAYLTQDFRRCFPGISLPCKGTRHADCSEEGFLQLRMR